jgi:uncharacterized protein (TIGR03437 family)
MPGRSVWQSMPWPTICRIVALAAALGPASHAATLVRKPYVQNVRSDSAAILWTTLESGEGAVECFSDRNTSIVATARIREFDPAQTGIGFVYHQYQADLSGLSSGAEYRCHVKVDGRELFPPGDAKLIFRTAASGPFAFLVFGDSGTGSQEQQQVTRRMEDERAALLLHTGDMVYPAGGFADQQAFYFDVYWRLMLRLPFFPCPGNHDYDTRNAEPYLAGHSVPGVDAPSMDRGRYYSFDWGNVHFISLDSNQSLSSAAAGTGQMLKWLERDLNKSRAFWRVAYFHHSAFAGGPHESDPLARLVRDYIAPILDRYDVPLVFNGHEHSYQRSYPIRDNQPIESGPGVVYITTGGGGAPLYPVYARSTVAFGQSAHHFVRAEVDGSRMTLRVIRADGREIDRVTLSPNPRLADDAVVNAASFTPALAPGGLVAIFGRYLASEELIPAGTPLPTTLGGVSAELNGRPLPLLYVSGSQINAQIPFDIQGPATLRIITENGTAYASVVIREVAPAIFSVPIEGGLSPVVLHENGSRVSALSPAKSGERVSIHLTGLGQVDGSILAGEVTPVDPALSVRAPIEVQIDGTTLTPSSARLLPGSVGVYRVEVQIPSDFPGGTHELRIRMRETGSNTATLTVR